MIGQLGDLLKAVRRYAYGTVVPGLSQAGKDIPDARGRRGRTRQLADVIGMGCLARMSEMRTDRQAEMLSEFLAESQADAFVGKRLSDSSLQDVLRVTGDESTDHLFARFTRSLKRDKRLSSGSPVYIGKRRVDAVMYDGQDTFRTQQKREGYAKRTRTITVGRGKEKHTETRSLYALPVVHAVLASTDVPTCIGQRVVVDNDENSAVLDTIDWVTDAYRWMRPGGAVHMADAKHGTTIFFNHMGNPYEKESPGHFAMTALKGTQKKIYEAAREAFELQEVQPSRKLACTKWEDVGHGREVMREVYTARTNVAAGLTQDEAHVMDPTDVIVDESQWGTINQLVMVRQTTRYKTEAARQKARRALQRRKAEKQSDSGRHVQLGDKDRHYRYFALNVKSEDVAPATLLRLVRMMWQVEVFHNHLSQYMHVKAGDWVRQGKGPAVVTAINAIALNYLLLFQKRRLRHEGWRNVVTLPQLMQVFMIVIAAGAIEPLLAEKEKSRKEPSAEILPSLTNEELVDEYFSGEELKLIALAFKNLVLRTIGRATTWLSDQRQKLIGLITLLKERPLLAG